LHGLLARKVWWWLANFSEPFFPASIRRQYFLLPFSTPLLSPKAISTPGAEPDDCCGSWASGMPDAEPAGGTPPFRASGICAAGLGWFFPLPSRGWEAWGNPRTLPPGGSPADDRSKGQETPAATIGAENRACRENTEPPHNTHNLFHNRGAANQTGFPSARAGNRPASSTANTRGNTPPSNSPEANRTEHTDPPADSPRGLRNAEGRSLPEGAPPVGPRPGCPTTSCPLPPRTRSTWTFSYSPGKKDGNAGASCWRITRFFGTTRRGGNNPAIRSSLSTRRERTDQRKRYGRKRFVVYAKHCSFRRFSADSRIESARFSSASRRSKSRKVLALRFSRGRLWSLTGCRPKRHQGRFQRASPVSGGSEAIAGVRCRRCQSMRAARWSGTWLSSPASSWRARSTWPVCQ